MTQTKVNLRYKYTAHNENDDDDDDSNDDSNSSNDDDNNDNNNNNNNKITDISPLRVNYMTWSLYIVYLFGKQE